MITTHVRSGRRLMAAACAVALLAGACGGSGGGTATPGQPTPAAATESARLDRFVAQMESLRGLLLIPGMSAAVVRDQELLWADGFGYADVAGQVPATGDTPFHLASVTKPLAATVLMQLVEEGVVSLDDTVAQYGVTLDGADEIQVRHLLTHTSEGVPGATHHYNGDRYAELGKVIEAATGRAFRTVMYERLMEPLGMTGTAGNHPGCDETVPEAVATSGAAVRGGMARPYQLDDHYEAVESYHHTHYSPAAGLISSVADLAAFDIALDRGVLLSDATKAQMMSPLVSTAGGRSDLQYGLGWYVQDFEGTRLEWHYGRWPPSVSALYVRVPEHGLTLIVLANTPNLTTPFPVGNGDVMASALALSFYREFVYPRVHGSALPVVDWEAGEEELISQLGAAADDTAARFLQQELAAYRGAFYSVGRSADVDRLQRAGRAAFPGARGFGSYFDTDATSMVAAPVELTGEDLQRLAGTYVFDESASDWPAGVDEEPLAWVRVTVEGDTLLACAADGSTSFILPLADGRFLTTDGIDLDVEYVDGQVARITARPGGPVALVYVPEGADAPGGEAAVWPIAGWPVSKPEQQGMDSGRLADLVEEMVAAGGIDSVMVIRNGYSVLDAVVHPFPDDTLHIVHSVTKSITGTLIGIAVDQGLLAGVDVPVVDVLADAAPGTVDARQAAMTVEDLLTMSTGLDCRDSYLYAWQGLREMTASEDWTAHVLGLPMAHDPGTRFEYCNGSSFLLSAVISEVTGMPASEYAAQVLFGPLGIEDYVWPASPDGVTIGWGESMLRPADMARFGYLYLRGGEWDGDQIVAPGWVEEATSAQIEAGTLAAAYGYQWWISDDGYAMAQGFGGQHVFVISDLDLVVVYTAGLVGEDHGLPVRLTARSVIPAVVSDEPLPADPADEARLAAAVEAARSGPSPARVEMPDLAAAVDGARYDFRPNPVGNLWFAIRFEDDAGVLAWETGEGRQEYRFGVDGRFLIDDAEPVALRGSWRDDTTFVVEYQVLGQVERGTIEIAFEGETAVLRLQEPATETDETSVADRVE